MSLQCFYGGQEEGVKNPSPPPGAWGKEQEAHLLMERVTETGDLKRWLSTTAKLVQNLVFLWLASLSPYGIKINHNSKTRK